MKKLLPRLTLAAAATACAAASHAVVITFDAPIDSSLAAFAPLLTHDDEITTQAYFVNTLSTKAGAQPGDLVGALVDGSSLAATCVGLVCPTNNSTNFLAALNDGYLAIGRVDGVRTNLTGFSASFIAAPGAAVPALSLILRVDGLVGSTVASRQDFNIPGPTGGIYSFAAYSANAAFSTGAFDYVAIYGFACDAAGNCSRALDRAQFALDNVNVNAVPEPGQWLLMGLGLAGVGAATRRRRRAA